MGETLDHLATYLILLAEAASMLVILVAVLRAVVHYADAMIAPGPGKFSRLRARLGYSMIVALEFLVAADIVRTGLAPNWTDILSLGALIAIRTALSFLLEYELGHLSEEQRM